LNSEKKFHKYVGRFAKTMKKYRFHANLNNTNDYFILEILEIITKIIEPNIKYDQQLHVNL